MKNIFFKKQDPSFGKSNFYFIIKFIYHDTKIQYDLMKKIPI